MQIEQSIEITPAMLRRMLAREGVTVPLLGTSIAIRKSKGEWCAVRVAWLPPTPGEIDAACADALEDAGE